MTSSPPAQQTSPPGDASALFSVFSQDDHSTSAASPQQQHEAEDDDEDEGNSSGGGGVRRNSTSEDNFKTGRWTRVEHDRFIQAFTAYDKDWRKVSEFVGTRSNIQCRTHAQKHFKGLAARELKAKARSMQTANGNTPAHPQMLQQPQFLSQFSIPQQQQQQAGGGNNVGMYFPVGYPPQMYYLPPQHPWGAGNGGTPAQQFAPSTQQSKQHSPPPYATMPPPPAGFLPNGVMPNFTPQAAKNMYAGQPKSESTNSESTSAGVEALLSLF